MKIERTFLRSKVARRIFTLFICCALIPIGALGILSFNRVEKQLNETGQRRLHHANKAVGMAILERLAFLEDEMKGMASRYRVNSSHTSQHPATEFGEHLGERFKGLAIFTGEGKMTPLFGNIENVPELAPEQRHHLQSGGVVLFNKRDPDLTPKIGMVTAIDSKNHGHGLLLGQVNPAYL
jgi:hypothetical protein